MLNKVILIGRLVRDVDLKYTASNTAVATFTLAVDRGFKNANGEKGRKSLRQSGKRGKSNARKSHGKEAAAWG